SAGELLPHCYTHLTSGSRKERKIHLLPSSKDGETTEQVQKGSGDHLVPLPLLPASDKACARRHHAARGGIALPVLPAALRLRRGGGRQTTTEKRRFGRRRLRVMGRADLHGCRRRPPGGWAARAGLPEHRHCRQLGGRLPDELVGRGERGRCARRGAGGHAAEPRGQWWQCPHGQDWCLSGLHCPQTPGKQQGGGGGRGVASSSREPTPSSCSPELSLSHSSVTE
ncbi:unnamed protein product, partial [Gulo gulo]